MTKYLGRGLGHRSVLRCCCWTHIEWALRAQSVRPLHSSGATEAQSVSERAAVASAIAAASAAVSTVFALVVGAIAIIAIIIADRSETKSVEQLKLDFAALGSTLLFLRDRAMLYTDPDAVNVDLDPFKGEREALTRILTSSTGFALYVWTKDARNEKFTDLYSSLAGLVDVTTLDLRKNFQPVANLIKARSSEILRRLASVRRTPVQKYDWQAIPELGQAYDRQVTLCRRIPSTSLSERLNRRVTPSFGRQRRRSSPG